MNNDSNTDTLRYFLFHLHIRNFFSWWNLLNLSILLKINLLNLLLIWLYYYRRGTPPRWIGILSQQAYNWYQAFDLYWFENVIQMFLFFSLNFLIVITIQITSLSFKYLQFIKLPCCISNKYGFSSANPNNLNLYSRNSSKANSVLGSEAYCLICTSQKCQKVLKFNLVFDFLTSLQAISDVNSTTDDIFLMYF